MAASSDEERNVITEADDDYYTFLNIRREAAPDEITNAYRRLSRLYHPDKHSDPVKKRQAENLFSKTKKAYEVLNDPHRRAIYDSLGTKGLETEGWEIVQRTKTPQEIREEYERLAREKAERKLQQRTNPKGSVTVNINATDLFDSYEDGDDRPFPLFEVSGMSISQSIEAPVTLNDTLTLGGQLHTHNGNGSGTVNCSWRRVLSAKSWCEVDFGAGNGPLLSLRLFRSLSKRSFANMAGIFQLTPHGIRPGVQTVIGRQLDKHTMGYLTWKAGMQSCMNTMVVWDTSSSHLVCSLQFGIPNTFAMLSYTHKFQEDGKIRGVLKAGTFGILCEYGCEVKVSQHSILGATMALGVPVGVTLKLKVNRGSQNYIFPIFLSEHLLPSPILYGTVVPVVAYFAMKAFIITPYLKQQKQRSDFLIGRMVGFIPPHWLHSNGVPLTDAERQREANATKMAEQKKEAEASVSLMQETFQRIKEQEEGKKGLVVMKALYGKLVSENDSLSQSFNEIVDVTVPVQCLVKDSKLILPDASKSQLPGFYDPCVGEEKSLYIQYIFHTMLHEVTIDDKEILRIPKQSHRVDS